jgi:hypothetical protein
MHGLINRSLQGFLRDTYGTDLWASVAQKSGVGPEGFEAMLSYDDALTDMVLAAATESLIRPRDALLEDLGMYLVSLEPLRRLFRFGGVTYVDFLHSLDELPDRARLAVTDIGLPELELSSGGDTSFALQVGPGHRGFVPVFAGILRAMADDYGAFALVDVADPTSEPDTIRIELLEASFATGRAFDLARPEGA